MNICINNSYNKKVLIKNYVYDIKRLRIFVFILIYDIYCFFNLSFCWIWIVFRIRYFIEECIIIYGIGLVDCNIVN